MRIGTQGLWAVILAVGLSWTPAAAQKTEQTAPPAGSETRLERVPEESPPSTGDDEAISERQTKDGPGTTTGKKPPPGNDRSGGILGNPMLLVMLGALVLMFVFSSRGRKKREAKRRDMLASLSKGDKITTIGGIVGTVIEVREDEITVKVDETNNVRMRFARWAIRGVGEDAKTHEPDQKR